ncbi:hypothetical protein ABPG72_013517 [Tetrahymena utriculariae]
MIDIKLYKKPFIRQFDNYDKIYGQRNHRNYSCLQPTLYRENITKVDYDFEKLYDKDLIHKYIPRQEEKQVPQQSHSELLELMIKNNALLEQEKQQKYLKQVQQKRKEVKITKKKSQKPNYIVMFETFNKCNHQIEMNCKACSDLKFGQKTIRNKSTAPAARQTDLVKTLIQNKIKGKL